MLLTSGQTRNSKERGGRSRVPWPCACPGHASQGRGQGVRANLQPPLGRGTHLTASPRCREPMRCRPPAGGRHREEEDNGWPICRAPQRGGMAGPQEKAPVVGKWLAHSRAPHGWWCGLIKPDFELEDTSTRELKFEKRNFQFVDPRVLCKNSNSGLKSPHHQQWRSCPP